MIEATKLYKTIFKRKSTGEYDLTPLDEHTLTETMARTSTLMPMYDEISIDLQFPGNPD